MRKLVGHEDWLHAVLAAEPDITLAELQRRLASQKAITISQQAIDTTLKRAGALLLHPPAYSPDLNPIEQVFAKLKALLSKAAARSKEALRHAIAEALDPFSPGECRNFFLNAG